METSAEPLSNASDCGAHILEIRSAYHRFQDAVFARRPVFAAVELEPTTRCTAHCTFCPRHALTRPGGDMTPDDARSIGLHLAARPPMAVLLSGFGEPTLHGDLPGIAGALRTHYRGLIGVVTNAERLTPALAGALLDAGVGFFHISVAAACAATAGRIAPGLDFAQSTAHIEALLARAGRTTPIAVNLVLTPENRRERDAIIDRWHSRGACAVYAAPRHSRGGALYRPVARERAACWVFTRTLFAAWNGRVLACCHDVAGTGDYGNLALEPIARITPRRAARMRYTLGSAMCRRCDFPLTDAPATGAANAAAFAP